MDITEFHTRLDSRNERSRLFEALRNLRSKESLERALRTEGQWGWCPWNCDLSVPPLVEG